MRMRRFTKPILAAIAVWEIVAWSGYPGWAGLIGPLSFLVFVLAQILSARRRRGVSVEAADAGEDAPTAAGELAHLPAAPPLPAWLQSDQTAIW